MFWPMNKNYSKKWNVNKLNQTSEGAPGKKWFWNESKFAGKRLQNSSGRNLKTVVSRYSENKCNERLEKLLRKLNIVIGPKD